MREEVEVIKNLIRTPNSGIILQALTIHGFTRSTALLSCQENICISNGDKSMKEESCPLHKFTVFTHGFLCLCIKCIELRP